MTEVYEFSLEWNDDYDEDVGFNYDPRGVAVASDGSVYVADDYNCRIQKFTSDGVFVSKWGTQGDGDGQFNEPIGVVPPVSPPPKPRPVLLCGRRSVRPRHRPRPW